MGGREDLCLKVDEGIGGSPAERVRADGPIAISESKVRTGGSPTERLWADWGIAGSESKGGWIAISESTGGREDLCLKVDEGMGGSPAERVRVARPIAISESKGRTEIND